MGAWAGLGYYSRAAGRADEMTFVGEHGVLSVDRFRTTPRLSVCRRFGYGVRRAFVPPSAGGLAWQAQRWWRPSWESSYRRSLAQFASMCRGAPGELATMADGREALRVVLAAEATAAHPRPGQDGL